MENLRQWIEISVEVIEGSTVYILVWIANGFTLTGRAILRFACWLNDVSFDELDQEAEKRGRRI